MSEPDWEQFRVDEVFDPKGVRLSKLFGFMRAFLDWQRDKHASTNVRSENVPVSVTHREPTKARRSTLR